MNEKQLRRKIAFRRAAIVFSIACLLLLLLAALRYWESRQEGWKITGTLGTEKQTVFSYDGKKYELKSNLETILVMGLDKFEASIGSIESYNNDQQADFLLLLLIDHEEKKCVCFQLNRDTMAEISVLGVGGKLVGTTTEQLALAHTYGSGKEDSCRNTVKAVSTLLDGLTIDHYLSMTMDAVSVLNDQVGGVTVTVLDDLTAFDSQLVEGEQVTLQGSQALTYVRSRQGLENATNLRRMERQRQYLEALYVALSEHSREEGFSLSLILSLNDYLVSDCSASKWQELVDVIKDYSFEGILSLSGTSVVGNQYMEFYLDEDAWKKVFIQWFCVPMK
jgi:LCP family protein required for cell wall assembly